jgi:hypothetical protein
MGDCKEKSCCCKCSFQLKLTKHPWNQNPIESKGRVTELFGYACTVQHDIEHDYTGTFYDSLHGECEMFRDKDDVLGLQNAL